MAVDSGNMSLGEARRGVKKARRGRESTWSVSQVTEKWKAAKVSWVSLREGSLKMALLVKT